MVASQATTESRSQHAMHLLPIVIAHTDFQYVYKLLHFGSVYLVIPVFGFDFSTSLSVSNDLRCRAGNVRWSFPLIFFFLARLFALSWSSISFLGHTGTRRAQCIETELWCAFLACVWNRFFRYIFSSDTRTPHTDACAATL